MLYQNTFFELASRQCEYHVNIFRLRRKRFVRSQDKGVAEEVGAAAEDAKDGAKSAVEEAEAAFKEQANKANQAVSQKGVVEGTVKEPLAQGRPATDPNNAW